MVTNNYDLVVIGNGPAGQKGAIAAAKLGKRVAIVDREEMIGGVCLQTAQLVRPRSHSASRFWMQTRLDRLNAFLEN